MVFQHPAGTPTKAWFDDYGILMTKNWKSKAVVTLAAMYIVTRAFVNW